MDDRAAQQRGVIALVNMSQDLQARALMFEYGAAEAMVLLLDKPDELTRRGCAAVLTNLCSEKGREEEIMEAGALNAFLITALVVSDHDDTKQICAKGLYNLLFDPELHEVMVKDGVIWAFATLSKCQSREVEQLCVAAICNLSVDFWKEGFSPTAVNALLRVLQGENSKTRIMAAKALCNMLGKCTTTTNTTAATTTMYAKFMGQAVPVLKELTGALDEDLATLAGWCLTYIAMSEEGRGKIIEFDALSGIESFIVTATAESGRMYAALLLYLCTQRDSRAKALEIGALDGIIMLSEDALCEDPIVARCCLRALYGLSCEPVNVPKLVANGAIKCLGSFLSGGLSLEENTELLLLEASMLYNMTLVKDMHADLVLQGIVRIMKDQLFYAEASNDHIRRLCSTAVCNLACGRINSSRMIQVCVTLTGKSQCQHKTIMLT